MLWKNLHLVEMEATSLASICLQSRAPVQAILMWFAVEKKHNVVCYFSAVLKQQRCVRLGGLAGMYACNTCTFAVLSAGCGVIHSVTANTYWEKEKNYPMFCLRGL